MSGFRAWYADLKKVAKWIWVADAEGKAAARGAGAGAVTGLFHGVLDVPAGAASVELHVSADSRYTLWVRKEGGTGPAGMPLGRGPARGDLQHTSVDAYGLGVDGGEGVRLHVYARVEHVVAGPLTMYAEMHGVVPGFYCAVLYKDGRGAVVGTAGTDKGWDAVLTEETTPRRIKDFPGFFAIGAMENWDAGKVPAGWLSPLGVRAGGESVWRGAVEVGEPYFKADPDMPWGTGGRPWLIEREIAPLEQGEATVREWRRVAGEEGGLVQYAEGEVRFPVRVGPGEKVRLVGDMGEYVLAYPTVRVKGGARAGACGVVKYAEVLAIKWQKWIETEKSFDLGSGYPVHGITDGFTTGKGGDGEVAFTPTHWRAFRFIEVEVEAGAEGAEILGVTLERTGYPFEYQYAFRAEGESREGAIGETVDKIVDVSWRTIKSCTWETYMDCPFYEQLQYIGDTRIQALCTYVATGDPTLPAQALRAFDRSRIYEGITQSRYPSWDMQLIPTFSLIYVLMIDDYLTYTGDEGLVAELRTGIAPILNWFTRFTDPRTGLIGTVPYWAFVDWVSTWPKGTPPGPISSVINMQYLMALDAAGRVYERTKAGAGAFYVTHANALRAKIRDHFFDAGTGLIADTPVRTAGDMAVGGERSFSQHAQALAVLSGVLTGAEARHAMGVALDERNVAPAGPKAKSAEEVARAKAGLKEGLQLAPASYYFRFYVAEALAKAGMGEALWGLLTPFREALARGSTTWPEAFEPGRSECHAWSSWPMYFFARYVLGVAPASEVDGRVEVKPLYCPPLERVAGTVVTARGEVRVKVEWEGGVARVEAEGAGVKPEARNPKSE